jgi:N-formylglutamate deformylase
VTDQPVVTLSRSVGDEVPVVACIPHSGTYIPPFIEATLTAEHLAWLRNTDWYLDQLYGFLPTLGVTVVAATHSRYVADVNRDPDGVLFGAFFEAVVAETTAHGQSVYRTPPTSDDLATRIERYHRPYHAMVEQELERVQKRFGRALLLDLHSYMSPGEVDVCLGNRHGMTTTQATLTAFTQGFESVGLSVGINDPWAGGHVIRRHAKLPAVEALQIELRYTTYLDCSTIDEPMRPTMDTRKWDLLQAKLRQALRSAVAAAFADA